MVKLNNVWLKSNKLYDMDVKINNLSISYEESINIKGHFTIEISYINPYYNKISA